MPSGGTRSFVTGAPMLANGSVGGSVVGLPGVARRGSRPADVSTETMSPVAFAMYSRCVVWSSATAAAPGAAMVATSAREARS